MIREAGENDESRTMRAHERFRVEPMYTSVTVRRPRAGQGGLARVVEGHAYDVSDAGARLELDEPLQPGEEVEVALHLPGEDREIAAAASVVWVHDADDDPAARRLAVRFLRFREGLDRIRLSRYLASGMLRRAA